MKTEEELKQQLLAEYRSERKKVKNLIILVISIGLVIGIICYFY
jgi:hypothetical protein